MTGPGFAAAAFARDFAILIGLAVFVAVVGIAAGVGMFVLLSMIFGAVL